MSWLSTGLRLGAAYLSGGTSELAAAGLNALAGDGSGGTAASNAADPFATQRGQYQTQLQSLMNGPGPSAASLGAMTGMVSDGGVVPGQFLSDTGDLRRIAQHQLGTEVGSVTSDFWGTPAARQMSAMTAPGTTFNSSDPSYAFRFGQGQSAVERSAAARGMLGSGNVLAALTDYGQGMASQEYGAQFSRLGALAQQQAGEQQQGFGQRMASEGQWFDQNLRSQQSGAALMMGANTQDMGAQAQQFSQGLASDNALFGQIQAVDTAGQNSYQNQYARLARLAGADVGQPGAAGQILQQQQAGAAAYNQQLSGPLVNGVKDAISSWWGGASGSSSGEPSFSSGSMF